MTDVKFLHAGDQALVVEFGREIDPEINARVLDFDRRVSDAAIDGVVETVPTYRSLLVQYDATRVSAHGLRARLHELLAERDGPRVADGRRWTLPVAYGGEHGVDLEPVARLHGLSPAAAVALHAGAEYRVYMIGFAPGFAYLGGLPDALHTSRRENPRLRVPAGSVAIGGVQACVMSVEIPSGWHLLGRTPVRLFDLRRAQPFLLGAGDRVRFTPVSSEEFARLDARAARGELVAQEGTD